MKSYLSHKVYLTITFGCLIQGVLSYVNAQQLPLYSQNTFNTFLLNPAGAGAEGYTSFNLTNREQWFGIEGAPRTYALSFQSRLMKDPALGPNASVKKRYHRRSGRVGLGIYIYKDHAGQIDQTGVQFTYGYHIVMNQSQISIGATFSLLQYMINTNNLTLSDKTDDRVNNNRLSAYIPDANLGVYYTDQHKFVGFSILQLSQAKVNLGSYGDNLIIYRHFYLIGGYRFELDNQNVLEPSLNIKTSQEWVLQMDAALKYIYDNKFWIGVGFRTGYTLIGSIGIKVKKVYVGYAYDYSSRGLLNYSYGSHELMLALKLGDNTRRYKWVERY